MENKDLTKRERQDAGVVFTPEHIAELFCDLLDIKHNDVLFEPCMGTGVLLSAGVNRLLVMKSDITGQVYAIEKMPAYFDAAMEKTVLHGHNIQVGDFFDFDAETIRNDWKPTVGFMNPPYSIGSKDNPHLYEISFIQHLLDSLVPGGRAAVIVPVSTMVGKTKDEKKIKADILEHHTLEGVISCNKDTFYGVGTVTCIAVFTAGIKHPEDKLVRFIKFEDDGYVVQRHRGLIKTDSADAKRAELLRAWNSKPTEKYSTKYMVRTKIEADDEWIHNFYYYNDEIPSEADFIKTIADYLTFEFNMIVHGRGYLFDKQAAVPTEDNVGVVDEVTPR